MTGKLGFAALCALTLAVLMWTVSLVSQPERGSSGAGSTERSTPTAATSDDVGRERSRKPQAAVAEEDLPTGVVMVSVLRHTDGDTLHVIPRKSEGVWRAGVDTTVRLLEIDTPESVDPSSPVECYSRKASRRLAELLPQRADAWALLDQQPLDPYGRTLAYLWDSNGVFVNLTMVEEGYATAVLYAPNDLYIREMRIAEASAQERSLGLWGSCAVHG